MASSVWRGYVTFALISIPVRLFRRPVLKKLLSGDCIAKSPLQYRADLWNSNRFANRTGSKSVRLGRIGAKKRIAVETRFGQDAFRCRARSHALPGPDSRSTSLYTEGVG
jgi:hypothetical protein